MLEHRIELRALVVLRSPLSLSAVAFVSHSDNFPHCEIIVPIKKAF